MCEAVDGGCARRRRPINKRPAGRCVFHTDQEWGVGWRDGGGVSYATQTCSSLLIGGRSNRTHPLPHAVAHMGALS